MLMTCHFDYCQSASEGDNRSVRSTALVVSRCFPGGYNVKLYISRGRLAWWLLAFLHSTVETEPTTLGSLKCDTFTIRSCNTPIPTLAPLLIYSLCCVKLYSAIVWHCLQKCEACQLAQVPLHTHQVLQDSRCSLHSQVIKTLVNEMQLTAAVSQATETWLLGSNYRQFA